MNCNCHLKEKNVEEENMEKHDSLKNIKSDHRVDFLMNEYIR